MGFSEEELNKINAEYAVLSEDSQRKVHEIWRILQVYYSGEQHQKPDRSKDPERVRELLQADGIHPNMKSQGYGETMLSNAFYYDMVKVLLEEGADPNIQNMMDGQNALDRLYDDDEDDFMDDSSDDENVDMGEEKQRIAALLEEYGAKRSAPSSLEDQLMEIMDLHRAAEFEEVSARARFVDRASRA